MRAAATSRARLARSSGSAIRDEVLNEGHRHNSFEFGREGHRLAAAR